MWSGSGRQLLAIMGNLAGTAMVGAWFVVVVDVVVDVGAREKIDIDNDYDNDDDDAEGLSS